MIIVGLLRRTKLGNYILTVVDHFTKYVEAYLLPDQEALTIMRVIFNDIISRFGVPYIIHKSKRQLQVAHVQGTDLITEH